MSQINVYDAVRSELEQELGYPINDPRFHMYLSAKYSELKKHAKKLEEELAFERKVNDRVNEIFKGWFHREG